MAKRGVDGTEISKEVPSRSIKEQNMKNPVRKTLQIPAAAKGNEAETCKSVTNRSVSFQVGLVNNEQARFIRARTQGQSRGNGAGWRNKYRGGTRAVARALLSECLGWPANDLHSRVIT